jgi:hypothetical protein
MSGRTAAYTSEILQSAQFLDGFRREKWRNYILNADDDNCQVGVLRFLVSTVLIQNRTTFLERRNKVSDFAKLKDGMLFYISLG